MKHLVQWELTGKLKYSDKTCSSTALYTINPHELTSDWTLAPAVTNQQLTDWLNYSMTKCINILNILKILYSWGKHLNNNNIWEEVCSEPTEKQNVSTSIILNPHISLVVRDQGSHPFQFWNLTPNFSQSCVCKKYIIIVQSSKVPRLICRLKRQEYMKYICLFSRLIGSELSQRTGTVGDLF